MTSISIIPAPAPARALKWGVTTQQKRNGSSYLDELQFPKVGGALNASLALAKYVFPLQKGFAPDFSEALEKEGHPVDDAGEFKSLAIKAISRAASSSPLDRNEARELSERSFYLPPSRRQSFALKSLTRLYLGLGNATMLETYVELHPLYGFPVIPGSQLKGLARAYAELVQQAEGISTVAGLWPEAPQSLATANLNDLLAAIFGCGAADGAEIDDRSGCIAFLDAWPTDMAGSFLDCEIINPHYRDYYEGRGAPADSSDPVPSMHLTVMQGVTFNFVVESRRSDPRWESSALLHFASFLLYRALTEMGAGGRTGSGYGFFCPSEGVPPIPLTDEAFAAESTQLLFDEYPQPVPDAPPIQHLRRFSEDEQRAVLDRIAPSLVAAERGADWSELLSQELGYTVSASARLGYVIDIWKKGSYKQPEMLDPVEQALTAVTEEEKVAALLAVKLWLVDKNDWRKGKKGEGDHSAVARRLIALMPALEGSADEQEPAPAEGDWPAMLEQAQQPEDFEHIWDEMKRLKAGEDDIGCLFREVRKRKNALKKTDKPASDSLLEFERTIKQYRESS
jgi:CRISPR-associated protein Cmr6